MIRQSPEVPIAVELVDVAQHIIASEPIVRVNESGWRWECPRDFNPHVGLYVVEADNTKRGKKIGRIAVEYLQFSIIEPQTECSIILETRNALHISDDLFLQDFRDAFRQYPHGRSSLILPS